SSLAGAPEYSPLLELISEIISSSTSKEVRIYVVTDMMENSIDFDFRNRVPDFKKATSKYEIDIEKKSVFVFFNYIDRQMYSSNLIKGVLDFWRNFFTSQGVEFRERKFFYSR
ncbi:hypothetical protein, partial [Marichromatium sp. AB31]|uniref:hypothetical protein n=1 Tax=Marichromatium sp. AB31 TaxID=2483362 RepID=UPI0016805C69